MILKLAYCATCRPAVMVEIQTEFKATPTHPAPDKKSVHTATIVDLEVDIDSAVKAGEPVSRYLNRKTQEYLLSRTA